MDQVEIDVNDVLNSLGATIANQSVQIASLQAQLAAYQKRDEENRKNSGLSVVSDPTED